jgi:hypothetical protein
MATYQFDEPMDLNRLSQVLGSMPEFQQQAPVQRETNRLQQLVQPQMPEFQGLGKYANPYDFAAKDPAGFAKVNPQYAQQMQAEGPYGSLQGYIRSNSALGPAESKALFEYEQQRGGRGQSAEQIMRAAGGNFDSASRELQLGGMRFGAEADAQKTARSAEDRQRKLVAENADLAYKGAQIRNLANPALQHIETENGMVAFNPRTGQVSPVQTQDGQPMTTGKPLTEVQAKGTGFATRARSASDIVQNIGGDGQIQPGLIKRAAEAVPFVGEGLGTLLNFTQSPQQQQVEQGQRDFVNALLRQESGAAITESEFANAKKQYFPQPGDTPQVIKQKAQNRENSIRALEVQAGPGMRRMQQAQPQRPATVQPASYDADKEARYQAWKKAQGR